MEVINVKITKLFLVLGVVFALGMMVSPALAEVVIDTAADQGTEEITYLFPGDIVPTLIATITYDADFEYIDDAAELDIANAETIKLIIDYSIVAESGFTVDVSCPETGGLRGNWFTPKNKVDGDMGLITEITAGNAGYNGPVDGQVELTFDFTELQYKAGRGSGMGNAHFHVDMNVTWSDGNSASGEEAIKFGVNCHVEDPQYTPPV